MTMHVRTIAGLSAALLLATACADRDDRAENSNTMIGDSVAATSNSGGTLATTDEIDIEGIELGRAVNAEGKIAQKMGEFRTNDTIIAVIETDENAAGKEIAVRWSYGDADQLIEEQTQAVAAGSEARTMFRITKASAWPTGKYRIRVMHNGKEVKSEEFTVK